MKRWNKHLFIAALAAVTAAWIPAGPARAQSADNWPARPVTIVVGFTAGGPTDAVARILAEQLGAKFGQSFVVDNKPGAGASIAAQLVKKEKPDGYTLMFSSNGALTINSLDDLLKQGRQPGAHLTFASAGVGVLNHLAGEWFTHEAKITATHIPYNGDSATISDLIAGRVDFAFLAGAAAFPQVKAGKLRLLASASATPGYGGEGVVTLGESHFKGFVAEPWNGLMGPAGMSPLTVARLNAAINEIMNRKEVMARLAVMDVYPLTGTPEQFTERIKEETQRWRQVIGMAGIKAE